MIRHQVVSAVLTGSGQSQAYDVTPGEYAISANVTAVSGAGATLDLWFQESDDGGTTWYDVPFESVIKTTSSATAETVGTNQRDLLDGVTAAGQWRGKIRFHSDKVREKHVVAGTTPQFTLTASINGPL